MEKSFYSDERAEDLLKWCNNLDALGDVITYLAWGNDGDSCFERSGECLGCIVSDYACAIHGTLQGVFGEMSEVLKDYDGSKIQKLQRQAERLKKNKHPHLEYHLEQIDEALKEFNPVFNDVVSLNSAFLGMRNDTVCQIHKTQQKRALAEADTETKAHGEEGQQPDSKATLA